jgi:hypothetical protein
LQAIGGKLMPGAARLDREEATFEYHLLRQGLSGVPAHLFRVDLSDGKGQPSLRARSVIRFASRFSAAATRNAVVPFATNTRMRSSSSAVHGLDLGRNISVAEKRGPDREESRPDPNNNGGLFLK